MHGQTTHQYKICHIKVRVISLLSFCAVILTTLQLCREAIRIQLKSAKDIYTIYIQNSTLNIKMNITQLDYKEIS